jgi:hypothetical protein
VAWRCIQKRCLVAATDTRGSLGVERLRLMARHVVQNCRALVKENGDLEILVGETDRPVITTDLDPIYLSIFAHRSGSTYFFIEWLVRSPICHIYLPSSLQTPTVLWPGVFSCTPPNSVLVCPGSWASRSRWGEPFSARPSA